MSILASVLAQRTFQQEPFRTELFPEQLEQQKIQFRQSDLNRRQQDLQRLIQVSSPPRQAALLEEQAAIQRQLQALQLEMIRLQEEIQRKLGNPVTFSRAATPPVTQPPPVTQRPLMTQPPPPPPQVAPRAAGEGPQCSTTSGQAGRCRPLIKCLAFYADLPELRRQPCRLTQSELGVCCPLRDRPQVGSGGSGVLVAPPPPAVVIPPLTPVQLNTAAQGGLEAFRKRFEFITQLFAQGLSIRPNTPAAWHLEFFPTTNATLDTGDQAIKNVEATAALVNQFNLSPEQGKFALPRFSILNTVLADTCPRVSSCPPNTKYRTQDGSCNNLRNPHWGQAGTALQRILPPKYNDGVNSPRVRGDDGAELPGARLVSTRFAQDVDSASDNYTMMVMQWGQFVDHDLTHTPISRGSGGSGISCCREGKVVPDNQRHPECMPILLPQGDHVFARLGETCMEFARSLPAPRPECNFGPREQMNQITGYLDGSNIYGSSADSSRKLRELRLGRLRVQNVGGRQLLPPNPDECTNDQETLACFEAGDGRVNEQVDLALMHTLWVREHNRVVGILASLHPEWNDEQLFQEAKRIVVAQLQHITYNEFLPIILGQKYMDRSSLRPLEDGWTRLYDPELNAGITNVFATAAFRFGHSLIQSRLHGYGRFGNLRENLQLSKQHFVPFSLYKEGAMDDFIRGLAAQRSQKFDRFFTNELTDRLFQGDLDIGLDLFALNLQRGRDHGLPPYNEWREVCGLSKVRTWQDLEPIMDRQTSVDEVDLFAGGVAEIPESGAGGENVGGGAPMLGPTFVCLIGDQFARLKRGDRFYYEEANQPSSFTSDQLKEIRRTSLARIICDNGDDIALMQPLAFIQPSFL
ncbi:hypothetical protein AAG570_003055 [Ranatra chinensis]|uniref:Peroxidase n=1 Tax=Ranatra chinensis TaxID=642074 RepID=A0ABD0YNL7_9HEMI